MPVLPVKNNGYHLYFDNDCILFLNRLVNLHLYGYYLSRMRSTEPVLDR